jgi:hypothetical protein
MPIHSVREKDFGWVIGQIILFGMLKVVIKSCEQSSPARTWNLLILMGLPRQVIFAQALSVNSSRQAATHFIIRPFIAFALRNINYFIIMLPWQYDPGHE